MQGKGFRTLCLGWLPDWVLNTFLADQVQRFSVRQPPPTPRTAPVIHRAGATQAPVFAAAATVGCSDLFGVVTSGF